MILLIILTSLWVLTYEITLLQLGVRLFWVHLSPVITIQAELNILFVSCMTPAPPIFFSLCKYDLFPCIQGKWIWANSLLKVFRKDPFRMKWFFTKCHTIIQNVFIILHLILFCTIILKLCTYLSKFCKNGIIKMQGFSMPYTGIYFWVPRQIHCHCY